MGLQKATFYLDAFPDEKYVGFHRGENWNGWACPYFSRRAGLRMVELYSKRRPGDHFGLDHKAEYDQDENAFRFYDPVHDTWEAFEAVEIDERLLFPIGTFNWTWSIAGRERSRLRGYTMEPARISVEHSAHMRVREASAAMYRRAKKEGWPYFRVTVRVSDSSEVHEIVVPGRDAYHASRINAMLILNLSLSGELVTYETEQLPNRESH